MHRKRVLLVVMMGLLVLGTVTADVNAEFDPEFDFSAYSSYAWREGTPARREAAERRIRDSVNRELAEAGLRLAEEDADLWVVTHVLVDRHTLRDLRDESYWEFYKGIKSVDPYDLGRGTVVIDLVDPRLEQIVWRGAVSRAVDKNMKPDSKKIDKAIHSVLKRLPR